MDAVYNTICRGCIYYEESATHILCKCEVFLASSFDHLDKHITELLELQDVPSQCFLNFASATGLFNKGPSSYY